MHIGIFGVSGAGKTTLTHRLVQLGTKFVVVSASSLIKSRGGAVGYSELGRTRIIHNQSILVEAYKEFKLINPCTLIELHSVVETAQGVVEIKPEVLKGLELDKAFFLWVDPHLLRLRRKADSNKTRRQIEVGELHALQVRAIEICRVALAGKIKIVKGDAALDEIKREVGL